MHTPYNELKAIMDSQYEFRERTGHSTSDFHDLIINLLNRHGIRIRQDDGADPKITFSIPQSDEGCYVIGLRYIKKDGTKTEDHYLFRQGSRIDYLRGRRLERLMPEYRGTHKLQR